MKVCKSCSVPKELDEFYAAAGYAGGYKPQCKTCYRTKDRKRDTPEHARNRWLQHKYGITLDDQAAMLARQGGACAICKDVLDQPHVDHCHSTGKVRALLCKGCNAGLGHFRDKPDLLVSAAEYLRSF